MKPSPWTKEDEQQAESYAAGLEREREQPHCIDDDPPKPVAGWQPPRQRNARWPGSRRRR